MIEKWKSLRLSTLKERKQKINVWLQRKCGLLFSTRNLVAVEEEFAQFNNLLKMLLVIHEEYNAQLEDEKRAAYDDWFGERDNGVCAFKKEDTQLGEQ